MRKIILDMQVYPVPGNPEPRGAIKVIKREVKEEDGSVRSQYIWKLRPSVSIVAVEGDTMLLKREFKYGSFRTSLTFAAGGIEPNETPEGAARRELMEEFGKAAYKLILLSGNIVNTPDKTTEVRHIFLAMTHEQTLPHEAGDIVRIPLSEARQLLKNPEMDIVPQRLALHEALCYLGL